ncbi:MAG: hypothetical protein WC222_02295 [Parachlamydiales bacterium]|jgi:hypothetical protein
MSLQLSTVVPLVGANFAFLTLGSIASEQTKQYRVHDLVDRVFTFSNSILAGCTALAVIGSGPVGYAVFGAFATAGVITLGKVYEGDNQFLNTWRDYAKDYEKNIGVVSSIVNLCGGVHSLIALPFRYMNLAGTLSAAISVYIYSDL